MQIIEKGARRINSADLNKGVELFVKQPKIFEVRVIQNLKKGFAFK